MAKPENKPLIVLPVRQGNGPFEGDVYNADGSLFCSCFCPKKAASLVRMLNAGERIMAPAYYAMQQDAERYRYLKKTAVRTRIGVCSGYEIKVVADDRTSQTMEAAIDQSLAAIAAAR